jgi:hypothetical protein
MFKYLYIFASYYEVSAKNHYALPFSLGWFKSGRDI